MFIIPAFSNAQSKPIDVVKARDVSRFVIVQSPIAVKLTFKLDTFTGNVYQLVVDSTGNNLWQHMTTQFTLSPDTKYPDTKNYSLFVSTLAIRYTFLVNTNTGTTWQLVEDSNTKTLSFAPMSDE